MLMTWSDSTSAALAEMETSRVEQGVAVLPAGAIEAHGPHLPLGTDVLIAERLLDEAAPALASLPGAVLRLPALWLGASNEHANRPGTVSIEAEVLIANVCAVAAAVVKSGIRRLLVLNAHGGNVAALSIAALKARTEYGMLVAHPHWLHFGLPQALQPPAPVREDVHGGWLETSLMQHFAAHLVSPALAGPSPPRALGPSLYPYGPAPWAWLSEDLAPGGWSGRPDLATAETGRCLSNHIVSGIIQVVQDLAAANWK